MQFDRLKRRDFISVLGGAATWPLAARAQQGERTRRIGAISALVESDPESIARRAVFKQALEGLGWTVGRNLQIDYRWPGIDPATIHKVAAELAALAPDVILATGNNVIGPMLHAAPTIPIVLTQAIDPVGAGFVRSMARPGGNVTGFTQFEYRLAGKWLELLREIAPHVTRVGVLRDPTRGPGIGQFAVIQAMTPPNAVELTPIDALDPVETQIRGIADFATSPNSGLIVTVGGTAVRRDVVIAVPMMHMLSGELSNTCRVRYSARFRSVTSIAVPTNSTRSPDVLKTGRATMWMNLIVPSGRTIRWSSS
jgi:putative ABC transport system substrate-binding protein